MVKRISFLAFMLLSAPSIAAEFYRDEKGVPAGWTVRGSGEDADAMCTAALTLNNGSLFSVTKSFGNKNLGVFLGVRNTDWNYPVTGKADNFDMMALSYDEDGQLIKSGNLLGILLRKDTVTVPVQPVTAYRILGRTAKLKIIPPNSKDGDLVVDGLGSRAVINSLLTCFDAAQARVKSKRKGNLTVVTEAGSKPTSQIEKPSFNCQAAKAPDELAICQTPKLSEMDVKLANLYSGYRHLSSGSVRRQLETNQASWLQRRRSCGSNLGCIAKAYKDRVDYLHQHAPDVCDGPILKQPIGCDAGGAWGITEEDVSAFSLPPVSAQKADNSGTWGALFKSQVERCWKKPYSGGQVGKVEAAFAIKLKRDGTLDGLPVPEGSADTPYLRAYQESAVRALVECQPYRLPPRTFR